ncbi:unnamed protein product [Citrullus colocynthis]|uniref:Retrotransposon Copia-like N-terminal domain-containing protein n=1 Tax=Citrullus colocynthis TaxID=252529 RepID=A0ABP0Z4Z2_9ROSI
MADATKKDLPADPITLTLNSSSSPEHSPLSSSPISTVTRNSSSSTVPSPPPHNTYTMITRAKASIHKPKLPFTSLTQSSSSVDWSQMEPIKFSDAIQYPSWKLAMDEEFAALQWNQTWI